jgi:hypothetical protein
MGVGQGVCACVHAAKTNAQSGERAVIRGQGRLAKMGQTTHSVEWSEEAATSATGRESTRCVAEVWQDVCTEALLLALWVRCLDIDKSAPCNEREKVRKAKGLATCHGL